MNSSHQHPVVGELRDWRKQFCGEDGTCVFWGFIYGDIRHRFPDGHWIHTSKVDRVEGNLVFTTRGNIYRLIGEQAGPDVDSWGL